MKIIKVIKAHILCDFYLMGNLLREMLFLLNGQHEHLAKTCECKYVEQSKPAGKLFHETTLIATCTGHMSDNTLKIIRVFYQSI